MSQRAPTLSLGQPFRRRQAPALCGADAVRGTDADALISRLAACQAGYLPRDVYAEMLSADSAHVPHRPPIISIGTYLRAHEVDAAVHKFLQTGTLGPMLAAPPTPPRVQVVSLGAGSDTRFWRMCRVPTVARYVEMDFPSSTSAKRARILHHADLREGLGDVHEIEHGLVALPYVLLGMDLSTLAQAHVWGSVVQYLDPQLPTLILCECVLAYIDADAADAMLKTCLASLPHASILSYDMCVGGDGPPDAEPTRFGQVMLQNLSARKLTLPGARRYTSAVAYTERFKRLAHTDKPSRNACGAYTLRDTWHKLERRERERVSMLERLDEVEELEMLLGHYCMAWIDRVIVQ